MKKVLTSLLAAAIISVTQIAAAQETVYTDASEFPLYGKADDRTEGLYERLPSYLKGVSRDPVWYLGTHSAGLFVRFRSNSTSIHVRWESTYDNTMTHMTDTGTKGLDLYALVDGEWRHVCSAQPQGAKSERKFIANMDPVEREYMLYLSLYDGVKSVEIGVDKGAALLQPAVDSPKREKPVVMYGTSLLQGGCANRPGMAFTSIISRRLDREVINLGFSGNAMLDMEIAHLMASVEDPGVFVLDYAPNAWDYLIDEKGEDFFRVLRDAHPHVPVIFIEDVIFPFTIFDNRILEEVTKKNNAQKRLYEKLKNAGEKNIYYIGAEGMIGEDGEATVDGTHFTDLGAMRYVDHVLPTIERALKKSRNIKPAPNRHVDVLVIGGGASGISAAIQSARMGVQTMVAEETPWIGGMLTSAGVSCVDGNYNMRSGIFGEFADSLAQRYGGWEALKTGWVSNINFEPNIGQEIFTNMAASCGDRLEIRRQTRMTDVRRSGNLWEVTLEDEKGSLTVVTADVLIDGTELGDVAKACGVKYRIGMESSEQTGESIAPEKANDVIQDLTYVVMLKDYGPEADMTIEKPSGYDPAPFYNSAVNPKNTDNPTGQTIWNPQMMITYGRTPGGRYMINWPIYGNDYYVNTIEMTPEQRQEAYARAKNFTLQFIYFIQTELGMKNLGIADDVFPTEDGLALMPYHRESRRIIGEAFFTLDAAAAPYEYKYPYYRTGIAVGDYAVDHHHFRHPDWRSLPDLEFYPIPSFNVPMGVLLPHQDDVPNLIVAEKSVSVSNLINGATRLQPVVMQLGQAAGVIAALSQYAGLNVKDVSVRKVQDALLESGCYIMPYLDLPKDHRHFGALQRIGAAGVLRGEGRNVGWANQTWFRAQEPLMAEDIFGAGFDRLGEGPVTVGELLEIVFGNEAQGASWENRWNGLGLENYDPTRTITRLEAAVVIDSELDPFMRQDVDLDGNFKK